MNKNAINKIQQLRPSMKLSEVILPDGDNLNEFYLKYGSEGVFKLLNESSEAIQGKVALGTETILKSELFTSDLNPESERENLPALRPRIHGFGKITFSALAGTYHILGMLPSDLGNMRITLHLEEVQTGKKHRTKLDLYDNSQVQHWANELAEKDGFNPVTIENDLLQLTDELDRYREKLTEQTHSIQGKRETQPLTPEKEKNAIAFLSEKNLMQRIDSLIEQSGVVGEKQTRLLLFVAATSHKMPNPLHMLVQGSSGSGKTHLISSIAKCFPSEDVISVTRITPKSLFNYTDDSLINKLFVIHDYDGLTPEAEFSLRELISAKTISSSTTIKDAYNNLQSVIKTVHAHFASFSATTKAEIYYDNLTRSIVVGVDETEEQTKRIIQYQNQKIAGIIGDKAENEARETLRDCIRTLKSYEVINPYADKVMLPMEAKNLRRLNTHFQAFVSQITLLHQYQRSIDKSGRLIATPDDLKFAAELLLDAIFIKTDELDSSTRQFFEQLKTWIKKQSAGTTHKFSQREIRQALNGSKSQVFRYMEELLRLEYISVTEGSANRGFKYRVTYWDDMTKLKTRIKADLETQIQQLIPNQNSKEENK